MKIRRAVDVAVAALVIDAGASLLGAVSRKTGPAPVTPAAAASGALATTPSEIPVRGWKQIIKRVFGRIGEDRVMAEAAAVTYYALLAIFPAIAAMISLYGLVSDPAEIGKNVAALRGVIPEGGMQIIGDQIHALTTSPHKALGFGAVFGLLTALWSANAGIKSLFDALNAVYEERETRSFVHRTWLSLSFTLGALLFIIIALSAVIVVPAVLGYVGMGPLAKTLLDFGRWPLVLLGIMLFLALVYRYGPSRTKPKWRWVTWGSAFAGVVFILASAAFSYYAANFGNYNKTYGSLGAAVGFMTWIWISTTIILVGAEVNAESERQTSLPTTA